jgi:hypothetical protein
MILPLVVLDISDSVKHNQRLSGKGLRDPLTGLAGSSIPKTQESLDAGIG